MIERVSKAAEKLAMNVSRRAFLGRLGKGALAAAGVLAGVLAFPRSGLATIICYTGFPCTLWNCDGSIQCAFSRPSRDCRKVGECCCGRL